MSDRSRRYDLWARHRTQAPRLIEGNVDGSIAALLISEYDSYDELTGFELRICAAAAPEAARKK